MTSSDVQLRLWWIKQKLKARETAFEEEVEFDG